jgi:outer membrane immunogenic protein
MTSASNALPGRSRATNTIWALGFVALSTAASAGAFAADLAVNARQPPIKVPAAPVVPPTPIVSWAGWYAGVNAGWVNSTDELNTVATPTPNDVLGVGPGSSETLAALTTGTVPVGHRSGFIGGGQIGYNWQFGTFVTGFETDIQGLSGLSSTGSITTTGVAGTVPVISTQTATTDTRFLGTVRARLGFLAMPTLLVYGTGGLAYGGVSASTSLLQVGPSIGAMGTGAGSLSDTRIGWTAGAGVEWMFAKNWSAKLEYLHYDLGTGSFVWAATSDLFNIPVYQTNVSSVRFDGDLVRAGVNLHF